MADDHAARLLGGGGALASSSRREEQGTQQARDGQDDVGMGDFGQDFIAQPLGPSAWWNCPGLVDSL